MTGTYKNCEREKKIPGSHSFFTNISLIDVFFYNR